MNVDEQRLPTLLIIPLVQIFVIVILFIALVNGQRELTILGLVVIAVLAGTWFWSRLSPANFSHLAGLDRQRGFPGDLFVYSNRVRNAKILPILVQLSGSFSENFKTPDNRTTFEKSASLLWYQETDFSWKLTAQRRGVYRIGPAHLKVGDLFGFYSRKPGFNPPIEVIVYPRLIPLKPISLSRCDFFGLPGSRSPIEDPVYVYGTREYQSGRPARYIHWKASARLARLQEKICEPATQTKLLLIVEVDRFLKEQKPNDFERVLEAAASFAVAFDRSGYAMGLITNGELTGGAAPVLPVAGGDRQISKILEMLARLQMRPAADIGDILRRSLKVPWGTAGISFSYDMGDPYQEISAYFSRRRRPLMSVACRTGGLGGGVQLPQVSEILALEDVCVN